jgi:hypothetical protein
MPSPSLFALPTLLTLTLLGLGCTKATVSPQRGSPDAKASVPAVDGAGQILVPFDARPREAGPGAEDVACRRSVNLRGVTITRPVPFDVVIVADNTDSLSWSRDNLSAGLKNLLGRVHGHEARFFVLTTTQYGASSQAAVSPLTGKELVSWHDPVSGTAYLNSVTTYRQECTGGDGAPIPCPKAPPDTSRSWKVTGTWQFTMPAPVSAITPDMDDDEISAQQKRIADAILGLGGGGSPQEQPICTLLRTLGQTPTALPKHAVFVVLTDEDDTSPPDVCLAGYEATVQVGLSGPEEVCESNCPKYVYGVYRPYREERLEFTCLPVDDKGTSHPEQATRKSLPTKNVTACTVDAGSPSSTCSDAELGKAGTECGAGTVVRDCTRLCADGTGYTECALNRTDNKTDLCTQAFNENGVRYANLVDYCAQKKPGAKWEYCFAMGLQPKVTDAGTASSQTERTIPLLSAKSTLDMIQSFKNSADRLIGKGKYSVETIVLDPAFSCPLHSGQSYATNLRTLASSNSDVFSLCDDYAPAIERIATFAEYLIQTTFALDLDDYEAVESVVVTQKKGQLRTVASTGYTYDRPAKLLRFNPGVLTAQDESLAVSVARECHRVIQ